MLRRQIVSSVVKQKNGLSVRAHIGDAKTLLAFDLDKKSTKNLAGFTMQVQAPGEQPFYIMNELQFETPAKHAQDAKEPPNSSINAPIHKFRWMHVPGTLHLGTNPPMGKYTYTVTPRYFDDNQSLKAIDPSLSVAVDVNVQPFKKAGLQVGFTRGYVQSQAYTHHFGPKAVIQPKNKELLFDTSQEAGTEPSTGKPFTFADEYAWLGYTARSRVFEILQGVLKDKTLHLDMFAYDLNDPGVIQILLKLAAQGRIRLILDNASLHHDAKGSKPEDQVEALFRKAAKKGADILRGRFGNFAHDKVLVVTKAKDGAPVKVLTGSTNFSVTGICVNSNHVLVFQDPAVVKLYAKLFQTAWDAKAKTAPWLKQDMAGQSFPFSSKLTPKMEITFAPHTEEFATHVLQELADRVVAEGKKKDKGSVLFAVMTMAASGPVQPELANLHSNQDIFSYGISDTPTGVFLYKPGTKTGLQVTGKPAGAVLPKPFNQVPGVGQGHQVHHKFVVCGFNTPDAVVYCGSSNLALGGEQKNGDNLLEIHDSDVATVFAIEALALVDHFNFLDSFAQATKAPKSAKKKAMPAVQSQAAAAGGWFLSTTDQWAARYYNPNDLKCVDRQLFA
jgi:phosphatidylserine/phosphatidylglycerophosphate/cardiolipin synthase-like enzyme